MQTNKGYRIFIVEDDDSTRASLINKISPIENFFVVGEASSVTEANRLLQDLPIDVLLADLQLPDGDGTEVIAAQVRRNPRPAVLVISVLGEESSVVRAIAAGAQGYLLKDDGTSDMAQVLNQLVAGGSPISPMIARYLIRQFQAPMVTNPDGVTLSDRETEVLKLAAKGFSYKETADILGVSVNTISTYTKRVYAKLEVRSRNEAVYEAGRLGLMPGERPVD